MLVLTEVFQRSPDAAIADAGGSVEQEWQGLQATCSTRLAEQWGFCPRLSGFLDDGSRPPEEVPPIRERLTHAFDLGHRAACSFLLRALKYREPAAFYDLAAKLCRWGEIEGEWNPCGQLIFACNGNLPSEADPGVCNDPCVANELLSLIERTRDRWQPLPQTVLELGLEESGVRVHEPDTARQLGLEPPYIWTRRDAWPIRDRCALRA